MSTLDRKRLTREDYVTFTPWTGPGCALQVREHSDGRPRVALLRSPQLDTKLQSRPKNEGGGFLYYRRPLHAPPLAGELRFRLTPSNDPDGFLHGLDYTPAETAGFPWCLHLPDIARNLSFAPIRHLLTVSDGLVPQRLMNIAWKHPRLNQAGSTRRTRYLHAFGQPFALPLERTCHTFTFVGTERLDRATLQALTCIPRTGSDGIYTPNLKFHRLFLGTAICCFEPSSLPEHSGKRVVVIRILRSLDTDPIRRNPTYAGPQYPPELFPRRGELLMKMHTHQAPRPWSGDVDLASRISKEPHLGPLGILFDNAVEYGSQYWP
ncbi:hypothetical protein K466DRAFT_602453 [Polyporus arcularius HHB13444]|uniref:Uncharacterized protein n=1 Tax=Polyporus arcularius HHB13444 TaxID=1314778 RepID=A0A5C3P6P9_9APHY|nr:hypothetical protein K466DRAFT_602453 [Polyporus arcularius HHB13444]